MQLGGPATPGVGWAAGIERILLAGKPPEKLDLPVAYVAVTEPEQRRTAFRIAEALRERGVQAQMEQAGRSVKGQFKQADRVGATHVVIVGAAIEVKHMDSGEQKAVADIQELLQEVAL